MNTIFTYPPSATLSPATAQIQIALEPVRNALVSLSLLREGTSNSHPWVAQTVAQLSPEDRQRQRLVFGPFANTLLMEPLPSNFPVYLDALSARPDAEWPAHIAAKAIDTLDPSLQEMAAILLKDPVALKAGVVDHLRMLWERHLAPEWKRESSKLAKLTEAVQWRILGTEWANRSASDIAQAWLRRELPATMAAQMADVAQIIFVLSPHADLIVSRFGSPDTAWVFHRFDTQMMRQEPFKRAEVLGGLNALADDNRLRILELLAEHDQLRAQDIVAQLTITQPNVSRHLKQLISAGFVDERRVGDANKWYRLNQPAIDQTFHKVSMLLTPENARAVSKMESEAAQLRSLQAAVPQEIRHLVYRDGQLGWSKKQSENVVVLDHVLNRFEIGRVYTEKEVNLILQQSIQHDHVFLRREMIGSKRLKRTSNGSRYWREQEN